MGSPPSAAPEPDQTIKPSSELEVKAAELEARRLEAEKALAAAKSPWWRRSDPLTLAIFAGVLTLVGNLVVSLVNNYETLNQEKTKAANALELEQTKARYNLVLQAMATTDPKAARRNILFFIDSGLLDDSNCKIREALEKDQPVLPALSGVAPPTPEGYHSAPEIATLYNFPTGLDGRDQTIGIIELGGTIDSQDLADYFKSVHLPVPDLTPIPVDGAKSASSDADYNVMVDIEVIGTIAPRAHLRVYFAPNTAAGFVDAIQHAHADHVGVLSTSWGRSESDWTADEIQVLDKALESAAKDGITILAAAGDNGVTDGVEDGKRHVDFPASSPWVLAVGGTVLTSHGGRIISETVWNDGTFATGGGISEKFSRPDWQSKVSMPQRDGGGFGRGIPDIAANGSPEHGLLIIVHHKSGVSGGTSISTPLFAGLIALINQGLGYNLGYLNPHLYQGIGPAGVFRAITSGNNGVKGVQGYTAAPGWSPVAGWGTPDGAKLLAWLRANPLAGAITSFPADPCR